MQKYLLQTHLHCNIIWKLCLYKYIGCVFLLALVVKHIKQQCEYRKQGIRNIFILVIIIVIMIKVLSSSTFTKDKAAITKYFYFRITTITVCLNIQLKKNLYQSFKVMWVDKFCTYLYRNKTTLYHDENRIQNSVLGKFTLYGYGNAMLVLYH